MWLPSSFRELIREGEWREMTTEHFEPKGWTFFVQASDREMKLVYEGTWKDWIVFKHPDGQWVSLRKATKDDWHALLTAFRACDAK